MNLIVKEVKEKRKDIYGVEIEFPVLKLHKVEVEKGNYKNTDEFNLTLLLNEVDSIILDKKTKECFTKEKDKTFRRLADTGILVPLILKDNPEAIEATIAGGLMREANCKIEGFKSEEPWTILEWCLFGSNNNGNNGVNRNTGFIKKLKNLGVFKKMPVADLLKVSEIGEKYQIKELTDIFKNETNRRPLKQEREIEI